MSVRERLRSLLGEANSLRVAQYPLSFTETAVYMLTPFLLIMMGAMPSAAIAFLPVVLPLLYGMYRRFGLYFPLSAVCGYGLFSLLFNYDILTVVYFCGLFFAFTGLVAGVQFSGYLAAAATAAILAACGGLLGCGAVRLAEGRPVADIAARYVLAERDDPLVKTLAASYYDDMIERGKLDGDESGGAIQAFSDWASDEFGKYVWYYCIHYGAVTAAVGFFAAVVINRRTASRYDKTTSEAELSRSRVSMGGAALTCTPVSAMSMPRAYLWTCVLPAALAAIVLEFVGDYDMLASTVMHTFATLPSAFTCFALFAFFASLFKGRARIAANVVLVLIGVAMVLFPVALFALSLIGVCDCVLNLRFWTKFIIED